jgi:hypothetical protein
MTSKRENDKRTRFFNMKIAKNTRRPTPNPFRKKGLTASKFNETKATKEF